MSKFQDILKECCKDGGECMCKKGKKCENPSCKCKDKKVVKESKFEKYLTESKLITEGVMDDVLRKEIISLGIPVPTTLTVDAFNNIKTKLKAHPLVLAKLNKADSMSWSTVETKNMGKFA